MAARPRNPVREGKKTRAPGGELALIEQIRARASRFGRAPRDLQLGIGDDCAILRPRPGEDLVVTTDMSLEGRHFRRDWHSPQSIGHRTLARGLSDLAAMGARPVAAFLSLALPLAVFRDRRWVDGFLAGLFELAEAAHVPLAGGDTAQAPGAEVIADIVLLGAVPRGRALRRDGARPGDRLFVTGFLAGSAAQLQQLISKEHQRNAHPKSGRQDEGPHFFPEPRLGAGFALMRKRIASAAMDISDGLSTDLNHLCEASGVSAEIMGARLPLHPLLSAMDRVEALRLALHGGEDYELLFAARPGVNVPGKLGGVRVTEIGRVTARSPGRPRLALIDDAGRRRPLKPAGWEHFR